MSTRAERVAIKKKELLALARKNRAVRDPKPDVVKKTVVKKTVVKKNAAPKKGKLPLSGSEEQFTNLVWGSPEGISGNNCYGYAMGVYRDGGYKKLQPGELAGTASIDDNLTKCDVLRKRTLEDLSSGRGGYAVRPEDKCKAGHYKIMGFVSPKKDYHWYRQNGDMMIKADGKQTIDDIAAATGVSAGNVESPSDSPAACDPVLVKKAGLWAHKRGLDELTVKDAGGEFIKDPRKANRDYGKLNYKLFCGAMNRRIVMIAAAMAVMTAIALWVILRRRESFSAAEARILDQASGILVKVAKTPAAVNEAQILDQASKILAKLAKTPVVATKAASVAAEKAVVAAKAAPLPVKVAVSKAAVAAQKAAAATVQAKKVPTPASATQAAAAASRSVAAAKNAVAVTKAVTPASKTVVAATQKAAIAAKTAAPKTAQTAATGAKKAAVVATAVAAVKPTARAAVVATKAATVATRQAVVAAKAAPPPVKAAVATAAEAARTAAVATQRAAKAPTPVKAAQAAAAASRSVAAAKNAAAVTKATAPASKPAVSATRSAASAAQSADVTVAQCKALLGLK